MNDDIQYEQLNFENILKLLTS